MPETPQCAFDRVVARLTGVTGRGNSLMARCPAHDDGTASLAVTRGDDRVLIDCHAGCTTDAVVAALGLHLADLFDNPSYSEQPRKAREVDAYQYTDELGALLYEVVRYEPKTFKQRRSDGRGGWSWNMNGVRRVLYRLPEVGAAVAAGELVWIVEGEKDVHALEAAGEIATTSPGGAGKWRPEYDDVFKGAEVIVVADDDKAGREHAEAVALRLTNVAERVHIRLPARGFKDMAQHLGAGRLIADVRPYTSAADDELDAWVPGIDWAMFWNMEGPMEDWLCAPLVPLGRQVAIFSAAGSGKSLVSLELAAALATGRACLGQAAGPPVDVIYVDMEMTEGDLRDRLTSLGYGPESDLSHLHYYLLSALPPLDSQLGGDTLMRLVVRHGAVLVVLDTMARVVAGEENNADTYRDFYRCTGRQLKAADVALLRLDHEGKDGVKGQRGSSSKADDLDVVFRLTVNDEFVNLTCTKSRVPWVPTDVTMLRDETGDLKHRLLERTGYLAGALDTAELLDVLGVPIDATARTAQTELKRNGNGKRMAIVTAALRYRREREAS